MACWSQANFNLLALALRLDDSQVSLMLTIFFSSCRYVLMYLSASNLTQVAGWEFDASQLKFNLDGLLSL